MKKILAIGIFLFSFLGYSQQIVKESIDSGGGVTIASGLQVISTLGEVVISERSNGNIMVSEGFISNQLLSSLEVNDFSILLGVKAYPNPTTDILNISFMDSYNYQIQVFDLLGKEVFNKQTNGKLVYKLDCTNFQIATYIVLVKNLVSKQYKVFKIIKK